MSPHVCKLTFPKTKLTHDKSPLPFIRIHMYAGVGGVHIAMTSFVTKPQADGNLYHGTFVTDGTFATFVTETMVTGPLSGR